MDDFSSMLISGYMFSKAGKSFGLTIRDCFVFQVPKEVIKESLTFGVGIMLFVFSYQSIGSIVALIYASSLPNYSTLIGALIQLTPFIALAEQVNGMHIGNLQPAVSEAFFNDKKNYARYLRSRRKTVRNMRYTRLFGSM